MLTPTFHVSLTRLRLRSVRFVPLFFLHAVRSKNQVARASGFLTGAHLADPHWTYWTMTAWQSQEHMRQYMLSGAHRTAMPHLQHWCDEASVAHWTQPAATLPNWAEADQRMRTLGRPSRVHHPGPQHAALNFAAPRTVSGTTFGPA